MADDPIEQARLLLRAAGVDDDELDDADGDEDALGDLAGDVGIRPPGARVSLVDVSALAGIPSERARELWDATGIGRMDPTEPHWFTSDADWMSAADAAVGVFGETAVLALVRRAGAVMSQLAHASASAFRVNVDADSYDPDVRLLGVVQRNLATDAFIETYLALAGQLFRHSARLSIRGDTVAAGELGELVFMTVGFVDLAASTELGQRTTVRELATLMAEFNDAVFGTASRHAVRVVKTIGDEAMLAADDPAAVALVALELVAYFGEHPAFGGARGGLAAGDVLDQDGDLYGPVVNRAARLVEAAADGTVMADETVGARLGARLGFEAAPIATHRGIGPTGWGRVRPGPLSSSRG